jgi:hypothetical protein
MGGRNGGGEEACLASLVLNPGNLMELSKCLGKGDSQLYHSESSLSAVGER